MIFSLRHAIFAAIITPLIIDIISKVSSLSAPLAREYAKRRFQPLLSTAEARASQLLSWPGQAASCFRLHASCRFR
jgi:hypothetical protein